MTSNAQPCSMPPCDGFWTCSTHRAPDAWDARCPICGGPNDGGDFAEVVYKTTGARGLAHVECYLQDTDCYDLA